MDHPGRHGPHSGAPSQRGPAGGPAARRDRQRADPRAGRPGCRRDGDPGRQARHLHRGSRDLPCPHAARLARRGDRQPGAPRRPDLCGLAPSAPSGAGLRRIHRFLRGGRHVRLPARDPPVGGLQAAHRDPGPGPLPGRAAVVQRRHPGHGVRGPGRDPGRPAACRRAAPRPALRVLRCRRGSHRHRPAGAGSPRRGRRRRGRDPTVADSPGLERPAGAGAPRA